MPWTLMGNSPQGWTRMAEHWLRTRGPLPDYESDAITAATDVQAHWVNTRLDDPERDAGILMPTRLGFEPARPDSEARQWVNCMAAAVRTQEALCLR